MRKLIFGISSLILLASCASEDRIISLQRELIELKQEVSQLKSENQGNKEKIEALNRRLDKLSQTVAENSMEIEKMKVSKPAALETSQKLPPPPSPPPPQQLPREGKEQVSIPSDEKGLYQYALDTYYKGNYEEARKYFVEFLKKYPDSELYGNAIFWAGQTFFAERKFGDSIEIFKALIQKCDEGKIKKCTKYPDAMLKIGYAYLEMGDNQSGKRYLQELIKKFPESESAQLARKKLEVVR